MSRKWRTAREWTWADWRLLLRAWGLLLLVDLLLRLRFPPRMWIFQEASPTAIPPADPATVQRVARMVSSAARHHLYPMTCLRRALVLQQMLARCGVATRMQIGVNKEQGQLGVHAWIEHDGRPVGDSFAVAERFVPLAPTGGRK